MTAGDNSFDIGLLRMEWAFPIVLENGAMNWEDIPNEPQSAMVGSRLAVLHVPDE